MKLFPVVATLLLLSTASLANDNITPSLVNQKAWQILEEIKTTPHAENITTTALLAKEKIASNLVNLKAWKILEEIKTTPDAENITTTASVVNEKITPSHDNQKARGIFEKIETTPEAENITTTALVANEKITPSHVHQKARQIFEEINTIREAENITTTAREPGVQTNRRPLHVFSKSLEVSEKIGRYQSSLGIEKVESYQIPLRPVTPTEVYQQAQAILFELSKIRQAKGLEDLQETTPFIAGKSPSDVYEVMWKSSYLLDDLAGQTSPNEVFRSTAYIIDELQIIAAELDIDIKNININTKHGAKSKIPKDVNLEAFKILHRVGRLQRYLGMIPFSPTPFPTGRILPNDALDSTNTILAELVRVKIELGINTSRGNLPIPSGKTPNAVFDQMLMISKALTPLLAANSSRNPTLWAEATFK